MTARRSTGLALAISLLAGATVAFAQAPAAPPAPNPLDAPPAMNEGPRAPPSPQMVAARRAMREACVGDIKSFCADVGKGGGGMMRCLRAHASELSPACASAGQAMREARHARAG